MVRRGSHSATRDIFQPSAGVADAVIVARTADTHRGLDAALCELLPNFAANTTPIDVGTPLVGCGLPTIGMTLQKSGVASC